MIRRPPRSTRTDTLFPYTTLFRSILGVGRAHDVAVALHRILAFEDLHDHGTRGHEFDEFAEEGAVLVDGIEAFGLLAGHADALRGDDAQAGFLQHPGDRAGQLRSEERRVGKGCVSTFKSRCSPVIEKKKRNVENSTL